jgi:hypothetical protein
LNRAIADAPRIAGGAVQTNVDRLPAALTTRSAFPDGMLASATIDAV